jgi:hypothetical protein
VTELLYSIFLRLPDFKVDMEAREQSMIKNL